MNHPTSILVTGATGFVGSCLVAKLGQIADLCVLGAHRVDQPFADYPSVVVGDINNGTDWRSAVHGQEVVISSAFTEVMLAFKPSNTRRSSKDGSPPMVSTILMLTKPLLS